MILRVLLRSCVHGVCVWVESWWSGWWMRVRLRWLSSLFFDDFLIELLIRCRMNELGVSIYSTEGVSFMLIIWRSEPYRLKETSRLSIQLSLLTVAWTPGRRMIVLATVEWLYIPFALSFIAHILWYGLPRPNDWCCKHQIKDRHAVSDRHVVFYHGMYYGM